MFTNRSDGWAVGSVIAASAPFEPCSSLQSRWFLPALCFREKFFELSTTQRLSAMNWGGPPLHFVKNHPAKVFLPVRGFQGGRKLCNSLTGNVKCLPSEPRGWLSGSDRSLRWPTGDHVGQAALMNAGNSRSVQRQSAPRPRLVR